jgi:CRP/FNR family transcriptional regulator, cyclic AMP receptor protein
MRGIELELKAKSILCREGEPSADLYFLQSGKLLVCTLSGTEVKVISRISPGEFIGELSFFDGRPRSGHVVTLEDCKLIQIPRHEIAPKLPFWYSQVGANLTKKIRLLDQLIHSSHVRKSQAQENRPLSIEEQRQLYELLKTN